MKTRFWTAALLFACFLPPAPQEDPRREAAARHAALAAAAAEQGDFARAEEEWKKVLQLDPGSARAFHNLGMVYYLERKYPQAEESLGQALGVDPSLANARVLLGASLARQGKLARATTELERALKLRLSDSAEKTARKTLFEVWSARENFEQALEVLRPLARKYPKDVEVLYALGQAHLQLSAETFRRMAMVDRESYRLHQVLADSLAKQNLYRDAIREYREALKKKPDLPGVHYQIGVLHWLNERTAEGRRAAVEEFEAELKLNPYDAWSEYRLGQVYWSERDTPAAATHFRRAVQLDKTLVPARLGLARALEAQGQVEQAGGELETAAKLAPDNPSVHYRLAQLHKKLGNEPAAAAALKKFAEIRASGHEALRELETRLRGITEPEADSPEGP